MAHLELSAADSSNLATTAKILDRSVLMQALYVKPFELKQRSMFLTTAQGAAGFHIINSMTRIYSVGSFAPRIGQPFLGD
jgi:hypothetical protein